MSPLIYILVLALELTSIIAQQFQCHVPGQCSGTSVNFSPAVTYNDCLDNCRDNPYCRWFTHFDDNDECVELYDCPSLDTTCSDCHSGQVECGHLGPVCDAQGVCIGHFVGLEVVRSVEECLRLCQSVVGCEWYSFRPDTKECQLTEDCIIFDGSCTDCLAGERECQSNTPGSNTLFVISGYPPGAYGSVEVIDLSEEAKICPIPQDFPVNYGSVATFIDDAVMVCGGFQVTDECYNYNPRADKWTETNKLLEGRQLAAAVQLSPTRWWITGGLGGGSSELTSTEMFTLGEGFSPYEDLPAERQEHNLVKINDTHVILLGGHTPSTNAWTFDVDSESWTPLPDLLFGIHHAHAGLVTNPDGSEEVIVGPDQLSDRTQILNLDSMTWRYGPDFPGGLLIWGASVPYGDTFLIVGGRLDGVSQDTIYKYEVEGGGSWWLLPQRLRTARDNMAALMVPDGYIACVLEQWKEKS